jgi:prepilin-type N-terminal cleavage/methylation domain-containing protein
MTNILINIKEENDQAASKKFIGSGFTLIEVLFTLFVIGMISTSFVRVLNSSLMTWKKSMAVVQSSNKMLLVGAQFKNHIKDVDKVLAVSLADDKDGFISYKDYKGTEKVLYLNSTKNQENFHENNLSKNSLVLFSVDKKVKLFMEDISEFAIELFDVLPLSFDAEPVNLSSNKVLGNVLSLKFLFEDNQIFIRNGARVVLK